MLDLGLGQDLLWACELRIEDSIVVDGDDDEHIGADQEFEMWNLFY